MGITRYILPVVVGSMSGVILITLIETWIEKQAAPPKEFIFLLVNYMLCSFIAGLIATLVAGRELVRPAIVVGIVLTLAGLYNARNFEHPSWFTVLNVAAYLPFAYLGCLAVRKKDVARQFPA